LRLRRIKARRHAFFPDRFKRIHHSIAAGEKDQGPAIHFAQRRRRPGAVKNARGDVLLIARHQSARVFVEHHQAGCVGRANALVGVVHTGAGVEVEVISLNENGAVRRVVRPDARALGKIEQPENVRVEWAGLKRLRRRIRSPGRQVRPLVTVGTVVPVRHAVGVQAHDLAAIADEINAVPLDGDG
jgi:hypothetical protein